MAMARLIWKEWREQRWKIGFGCVVLCAFALIGLRTRAVDDQSILIGTCAMGVLLLPILAAAGLVPAERDEGTMGLLLAMPVAPWKVLAAKTLLGAALSAVPLIAAACVSLAIARGREISMPATLAIYARAIATALCLFVSMFALTVRSESEGRAAGLAVGALVLWLLVTSGLVRSVVGAGSLKTNDLLLLPTPFVFVFADDGAALAIGTVLQLAIAVGLWLWAARSVATLPPEGRA